VLIANECDGQRAGTVPLPQRMNPSTRSVHPVAGLEPLHLCAPGGGRDDLMAVAVDLLEQ
jgi:hypothetical protein